MATVDPTRTGTLRKQATTEMKRRLRDLKASIKELVGEEDAFGFAEQGTGLFANNRWEFLSDPDKLTAFQAWFDEQVEHGFIEVTLAGGSWLDSYLLEAYRRATGRAFRAVRLISGAIDPLVAREGQGAFTEGLFNSGAAVSNTRLIFIRALDRLKGVTADMAASMSTILAEAIAHGAGAEATARRLNREIDNIGKKRALLIARTEMIHAYAEGLLDSYEALGVREVAVEVEVDLLTAGDDRVCQRCQRIADNGPYTIEEARGVVPVHPLCRCAWVPSSRGLPVLSA